MLLQLPTRVGRQVCVKGFPGKFWKRETKVKAGNTREKKVNMVHSAHSLLVLSVQELFTFFAELFRSAF